MVVMKLLWEVDIGFSASTHKLTLDYLEEVKVAPKPQLPTDKMSTVANVLKVYHDLRPWMTFRGQMKVMNVKMAYIDGAR